MTIREKESLKKLALQMAVEVAYEILKGTGMKPIITLHVVRNNGPIEERKRYSILKEYPQASHAKREAILRQRMGKSS
jgi:hypothetical protein